MDAEAIIAYCHELIAGYKCPRSVDVRDAPLPLSGAGKILKRELRRPFWEGKATAGAVEAEMRMMGFAAAQPILQASVASDGCGETHCLNSSCATRGCDFRVDGDSDIPPQISPSAAGTSQAGRSITGTIR